MKYTKEYTEYEIGLSMPRGRLIKTTSPSRERRQSSGQRSWFQYIRRYSFEKPLMGIQIHFVYIAQRICDAKRDVQPCADTHTHAGARTHARMHAQIMSAGAIPVFVVRDWIKPFQEQIDWSSFSFSVTPENVGPQLVETLRAIPPEELRVMQVSLASSVRAAHPGLFWLLSFSFLVSFLLL